MPSLFKGVEPRPAAGNEILQAPTRSPGQFADAFLEQVGLGSLAALYSSTVSDVGRPVQVIEKKLGSGIDWRDRTVSRNGQLRDGWLVLERIPGPEGDVFRARVFEGLAGATAEFCLKLKTHDTGDVAFHQIPGSQPVALEFNSPSRRMLMSHVSVGMEAASRLMVRE